MPGVTMTGTGMQGVTQIGVDRPQHCPAVVEQTNPRGQSKLVTHGVPGETQLAATHIVPLSAVATHAQEPAGIPGGTVPHADTSHEPGAGQTNPQIPAVQLDSTGQHTPCAG
jgi:hypothetical protein